MPGKLPLKLMQTSLLLQTRNKMTGKKIQQIYENLEQNNQLHEQ